MDASVLQIIVADCCAGLSAERLSVNIKNLAYARWAIFRIVKVKKSFEGVLKGLGCKKQ